MEKKRKTGLPLLSTRLTAVVSVAMVLLLLGLLSLVSLAARRVVTDIRQNMGFVVVLDSDATASDIAGIKQRFAAAPYVATVAYSSAETVLERWQQMIGGDEQITGLIDINPFAPEFEVNVKATYANPDSLASIAGAIQQLPTVDTVKIHTEMVEQVNSTMRTVVLALALVAIVLLGISFVLINNIVRLTIYSRRFTINTMRLVGATGGFIRRPIVGANIMSGVIAALLAIGMLAGGIAYAHSIEPTIAYAVTWVDAGLTFGGMMVLGIIICGVAAVFATNKYIRLNRDDLFR